MEKKLGKALCNPAPGVYYYTVSDGMTRVGRSAPSGARHG